MKQKIKSLFGVYNNDVETKIATKALCRLGFSSDHIWVLFPKFRKPFKLYSQNINQLKNGAIVGASLGATIIGGLGFVLAGEILMSANQYPISGLGTTFLVLGSVLFGTFVGAAAGALVGIGTPESVEKRYENSVQEGGVIVSIKPDNQQQVNKAKQILFVTGAHDINFIDEEAVWHAVIPDKKILSQHEIALLGKVNSSLEKLNFLDKSSWTNSHKIPSY